MSLLASALLQPHCDMSAAVLRTAEQGYAYMPDAIIDRTRIALNSEAFNLDLVHADQAAKPINGGSSHAVQQRHARAYRPYGHFEAPVATAVINQLTALVRPLTGDHMQALRKWRASEIGYQLYRAGTDFISAHRDRASDQVLSFTITISGSARILIFEPVDDPNDYTNLRQTDEFVAREGGLFMLRAPGFGAQGQTIHQVLPPTRGTRLIVNLRMRPTVLKDPLRRSK